MKCALAAASFALAAVVPILAPDRYGAFSNAKFIDHVAHATQAWVFLHHGFGIYLHPTVELVRGLGFAHVGTWYGMIPPPYPPGMFLLFLPPAIMGQLVPMSDHAFAVLTILYLLAVAHVVLLAVWSALELLPAGTRLALGLAVWLILLQVTLLGFYDGVILGCGAMMIRAMVSRRPGRAITWLGVAALLHFRAVALVPLGAWALRDALRGRPVREWPLRDLGFGLAACLVSVVSFALMYSTARLHSESLAFTMTQVPMLGPRGFAFWLVAGFCAAIFAVLWRGGERLGAVTALLVSVLAIVHGLYWWHGLTLVLVPLVIGVARPVAAPSQLRAMSLFWMICLWPTAFRTANLDTVLFSTIGRYWKLDPVHRARKQAEPWDSMVR